MSNEEIVKLLENMDKELKAFEKELVQLAWAMRGGLTLNEAYALSPSQRKNIADLFKENLETTKDSGIAFF
jgi:hypothetical protein